MARVTTFAAYTNRLVDRLRTQARVVNGRMLLPASSLPPGEGRAPHQPFTAPGRGSDKSAVNAVIPVAGIYMEPERDHNPHELGAGPTTERRDSTQWLTRLGVQHLCLCRNRFHLIRCSRFLSIASQVKAKLHRQVFREGSRDLGTRRGEP